MSLIGPLYLAGWLEVEGVQPSAPPVPRAPPPWRCAHTSTLPALLLVPLRSVGEDAGMFSTAPRCTANKCARPTDVNLAFDAASMWVTAGWAGIWVGAGRMLGLANE